ncbi:MAG: 2-nitropropane dioxygenase [Nocardioidaceae bacterium]|nr:2-nitropropane dioxygenase [Nocardioidaceae bacterium]
MSSPRQGRRVTGTAPAHAAALTDRHHTAITRAFTGRSARGLANRFLEEFSATAPAAYPEVHYATAPLRAAARRRGDSDNLHLWAGQAHELAEALPVSELVAKMTREAKDALSRAAAAL